MSEPDNIQYFANSVALIIDRASAERDVIASGWLIDDNKLVTTAAAVSIYSKHTPALEIAFKACGKHYGVERIAFHPLFKRRMTMLNIENKDAGPFAAIKKHNCAILFLNKLKDLSNAERVSLDKELSLRAITSKEGLSGTLSEIDFSLVVQTLTHAKKKGELILVNERNRPLAQIFCDEGRIVFARYRHLFNEQAIYQIIADKLNGSFYFESRKKPSWPTENPITNPTETLLLEAYRRLDELESLQKSAGGAGISFIRQNNQAETQTLPAEISEQAKALWSVCDGLTPANRLWNLVNLDHYAVFKILPLLCEVGLLTEAKNIWLELEKDSSGSSNGPSPLPTGIHLSLAPHESLTSLIIHSSYNKIGVKNGELLGAIDAYDSWHLIHNLCLLPEHTGSPIFKDGLVVAMQLGSLPSSTDVSIQSFQQCLWVDSITKCLEAANETGIIKRLTRSIRQTFMLDEPGNNLDKLAPEAHPSPPPLIPRSAADGSSPPSLSLLVRDTDDASQKLVGSAGKFGTAGILVPGSAGNLPAPADTEKQAGSLRPRGVSKTSSAKRLTGCVEVATISCPRCGSSGFHSARSCQSCRYQLISTPNLKSGAHRWLLVSAICSVIILIGLFTAFVALPQPNLASEPFIYLAQDSWLSLSIKQANLAKGTWESQPSNKIFRNGDSIHLSINVSKPSYVYLLHQKHNGSPELIFPSPEVNHLYLSGQTFTYPEKIVLLVGKKYYLNGMTFGAVPGEEQIISLASASPLQFLRSEQETSKAYQVLDKIFTWGNFPAGFEIEEPLLTGKEDQNRNRSQNDKIIFVSRLIAAHKE